MWGVEGIVLPIQSIIKQRHTYWYQGMPQKISLKNFSELLPVKSSKEHLSILQGTMKNHPSLKNTHKWHKNINRTTILELVDGKAGSFSWTTERNASWLRKLHLFESVATHRWVQLCREFQAPSAPFSCAGLFLCVTHSRFVLVQTVRCR